MKLSPWHSGKVKPVHVGVYEKFGWKVKCYSYWDGKVWGVACQHKKSAFESRYMISAYQTDKWRGIVK